MQILYGKNSVAEAIKAGRRRVNEIFLLEGRQGDMTVLVEKAYSLKIPLRFHDRKKMDSLAGSSNHQGIAARVDDFPYTSLETIKRDEKKLFLICDSLQDPQNFGAICRSAFCFGVDAVILNKDNSVEVTPAVCRASAGAVEHLPVARVTNLARTLESLKTEGFWIYAADPQGDDSIAEIQLSIKIAVVVGSEGEGIRPLVLKKCDYRCRIPQERSFDSLNAAQAVSIFLYEIFRRKGQI